MTDHPVEQLLDAIQSAALAHPRDCVAVLLRREVVGAHGDVVDGFAPVAVQRLAQLARPAGNGAVLHALVAEDVALHVGDHSEDAHPGEGRSGLVRVACDMPIGRVIELARPVSEQLVYGDAHEHPVSHVCGDLAHGVPVRLSDLVLLALYLVGDVADGVAVSPLPCEPASLGEFAQALDSGHMYLHLVKCVLRCLEATWTRFARLYGHSHRLRSFIAATGALASLRGILVRACRPLPRLLDLPRPEAALAAEEAQLAWPSLVQPHAVRLAVGAPRPPLAPSHAPAASRSSARRGGTRRASRRCARR